MDKRALILGKGYVGSALSTFFTENNTDFLIVNRNDLDYTNKKSLLQYILNNGITHVVNCVGFTGKPNIDQAETMKKECWDLNVVLPINVSMVCNLLNIEYIHVSSGCIYNGYEKEWEEWDTPNFGLYDNSSFYSKSKHAFETLNTYGTTIRLRMPFCKDIHSNRNYISKLLKYPNLINYKNSKTYIPDLCRFIHHLISSNIPGNQYGIINFTNPNPLTTEEFVSILKSYDIYNKDWKFVPIEEIKISAPRSNCVLSTFKLNTLFPDFKIQTESAALITALTPE